MGFSSSFLQAFRERSGSLGHSGVLPGEQTGFTGTFRTKEFSGLTAWENKNLISEMLLPTAYMPGSR